MRASCWQHGTRHGRGVPAVGVGGSAARVGRLEPLGCAALAGWATQARRACGSGRPNVAARPGARERKRGRNTAEDSAGGRRLVIWAGEARDVLARQLGRAVQPEDAVTWARAPYRWRPEPGAACGNAARRCDGGGDGVRGAKHATRAECRRRRLTRAPCPRCGTARDGPRSEPGAARGNAARRRYGGAMVCGARNTLRVLSVGGRGRCGGRPCGECPGRAVREDEWRAARLGARWR